MRTVWLLVINTIKVTFRKKGNIIVYLFLPMAGILFSMALYSSAGTPAVNIAVANNDSGRLAADFVDDLARSGNYKVALIKEDAIRDNLIDRKYDAAIVIPKGYEQGVYTGSIPEMEVASLKGQESTAWIENFINLYSQNLSALSIAANTGKEAFDRLYENYRKGSLKITVEELKDRRTNQNVTVYSMGFLIMFVMLGAGFTSQFILTEKRNRTYYRICSAPVSFREYIAGNALTSLGIVSIQIIVIQLVMRYIFHIETFVPAPVLFLILFIFGIVAIGVGMLITAYSASSYMSSTISTLVVTPTCMLSGSFWPVEFMPEAMRKIAFFMPQWWTLDAVKRIQTGGGFGSIVMNLVILLAFATALLLIAIYKFSKSGNIQKFV